MFREKKCPTCDEKAVTFWMTSLGAMYYCKECRFASLILDDEN